MKPISTAEKLAKGTYRPGRDRKTPSFVATTGAKAPAYVKANRVAHAEWKRVVPFLEAEGLLKETDLTLLGSYCILFARWLEAVKSVEEQGQTIMVTSTTRTGQTMKPSEHVNASLLALP